MSSMHATYPESLSSWLDHPNSWP